MPALFQRPAASDAATTPIDVAFLGPVGPGDLHVEKRGGDRIDHGRFVLAQLATTARAYCGRGTGAGTRKSVVSVIPTDGSISTEIETLADAMTVAGGTSARDHMLWLLPAEQKDLPASATPIVDVPFGARIINGQLVKVATTASAT